MAVGDRSCEIFFVSGVEKGWNKNTLSQHFLTEYSCECLTQLLISSSQGPSFLLSSHPTQILVIPIQIHYRKGFKSCGFRAVSL